MKKNLVYAFFALACLLFTPSAFAQLAEDHSFNIFNFAKSDNVNEEKVTFGARLGLNIASVSATDDEGNSSRVNVNFGISADIPVFNGFYIQSGLYLSNKGYNYDENFNEYNNFNYTAKLGYLQLPITIAYHHPITNGCELQINTGPYIACGIYGSVDWNESSHTYGNESGSEDVFGDGADLKRFDLGWIFGAAVTWQKMYFGMQYDLGALNIARDDHWRDGYSLKNRCFSINIGYNF